jgi:hypothetical protein
VPGELEAEIRASAEIAEQHRKRRLFEGKHVGISHNGLSRSIIIVPMVCGG